MKLWLPGAEKIPGPHSSGLSLAGGNCLATLHITASPKGSYTSVRDYLVRMGFEPTLILDPTTGQAGQYLPGNRGAYALEHPAGCPETNREGSIHVQVEWVWPSMSLDITKAPHFAEQWRALVLWLDQLGVPRRWPFGFKSTGKSAATWRKGGYRGHVNCPGNTHVDNLPAPERPAWPVAAPPMTDANRALVKQVTQVLNNRRKPLDDTDRKAIAALDAAALNALKR